MNELGILFIAAAMVICAAIYADSKIDIEAASNGLQQCVVKSDGYAPIKVWQKECK